MNKEMCLGLYNAFNLWVANNFYRIESMISDKDWTLLSDEEIDSIYFGYWMGAVRK